ncbi:unnamed protein product [Ectocarpus sp. CCAP 1310/34]|nr:unnamed protein product [Ectocarpus sp. CCAP 1310/34]
MADEKVLEMRSQLRRILRDILMQRRAVDEGRAKGAQVELAALTEECTLHLVLGVKPGWVLPAQPKKGARKELATIVLSKVLRTFFEARHVERDGNCW